MITFKITPFDLATLASTSPDISVGPDPIQSFVVSPDGQHVYVTTGNGSPILADENFGTSIVSTQPIIIERSMYTGCRSEGAYVTRR